MKSKLNPLEINENHTICLNSSKAIECTVVNIGTRGLVEGRVSEIFCIIVYRLLNYILYLRTYMMGW